MPALETIIIRVDAEKPDDNLLWPAAMALRNGSLVAFPTETVYGLGADALNPDAVAAIPHTFIECTRRGVIVWLMRRILMRGSLPPNEPGWSRRTLATDHMAMIIAPQAVADLLLEFA